MANKPDLGRAAGNAISTTLSGSITNSALSANLTDATGVNTGGGHLIIDRGVDGKEEVIYYSSRSGSNIVIADDGRGRAGTSAVSHDDGATVEDVIVDETINDIVDSFEVEHNGDGSHKQIDSAIVVSGTNISSSNKAIDAANRASISSGDTYQNNVAELGRNNADDASFDFHKVDTSDNIRYGDPDATENAMYVRCVVLALMDTDITINNNTETNVVWDNDSTAGGFDLTGSYDASSGVFTAPIKGRYTFSPSIRVDNIGSGSARLELDIDTGGGYSRFVRNDSVYGSGTGSDDVHAGKTITLELDTGDKVRFVANQNSGSNSVILGESGGTYFSFLSISLHSIID